MRSNIDVRLKVSSRPALGLAMSLLTAGLLGGCVPVHAPRPTITRPEAPDGWRAPANPPAPVEAEWWKSFHDPILTDLVERALVRNTDVLTALARLEEANAEIQVARSALLPMLTGDGAGQAQRSLGLLGPTTTKSLQPALDLSWEIDIFGHLRALTRAARLSYVATRADLAAIRLEVAASTAQAYVQLRSLDAQLSVSRETLQSREGALRLARNQAEEGYSSQFELSQAQSEYQSVAVVIPQMELAVRREENALRVLTGDLPGNVVRGAGIDVIEPPEVPGMMPSELLRRRPDVVSAEISLAASDATLEARRRDFLPTVQISSSIGGLFVNSLHYDPITIWSAGGSLLAPLFTGGQLTGQFRVANAQRDEAAYAYRAAVLQAFLEVENALTATVSYREQIASLRQRRAILIHSLTMARDRYFGGYASYLDVLDAQRNLFDVELSAISTRQDQLQNVITLYRALGGGWRDSRG